MGVGVSVEKRQAAGPLIPSQIKLLTVEMVTILKTTTNNCDIKPWQLWENCC